MWRFLGFLVSSWCLVHMVSASFASLSFVYIGVLPAGHALWADVGGGITFVTSAESTEEFIKSPTCVLGIRWHFVIPPVFCGKR